MQFTHLFFIFFVGQFIHLLRKNALKYRERYFFSLLLGEQFTHFLFFFTTTSLISMNGCGLQLEIYYTVRASSLGMSEVDQRSSLGSGRVL